MKNWVWILGVAALGGSFVACSDGDGSVAGSSMETENSIAVFVKMADGSPVARSKVFVRPSDFIDVGLESGIGVLDAETDENGFVKFPKFASGSYKMEVENDSLKGITDFEIAVSDSSLDSIVTSVDLDVPGSLTGRVSLTEDSVEVGVLKFANVGIQGTRYMTETDSLGNFSIENIPAGEFNVVVYEIVPPSECDSGAIESCGDYSAKISAASPIQIESEEKSEVELNILVQTERAPADTEAVEDTVKDTVEEIAHFTFEDFEDSTAGWYTSYSDYASGTLETASDVDGREGLVAHFTCVNDSAYNWALMGRYLGGPVDMSELDSVVLWARGSVGNYISFSFDVIADSSVSYETGKAWQHITVDTVWNRYVVKPSTLQETDSNNTGGNIGWDAVKGNVTNITIFGGIGGEIWIDDIEIYGMKEFSVKED